MRFCFFITSSSDRVRAPGLVLCVALLTLLALTVAAGCGGGAREGARKSASRESIFGEVVGLNEATGRERETGVIGWVEIEGARSQAVEEACLEVRRDTRIIDRRADGGSAAAAFDALNLRQTVKASFEIPAEPGSPARAVEITICP